MQSQTQFLNPLDILTPRNGQNRQIGVTQLSRNNFTSPKNLTKMNLSTTSLKYQPSLGRIKLHNLHEASIIMNEGKMTQRTMDNKWGEILNESAIEATGQNLSFLPHINGQHDQSVESTLRLLDKGATTHRVLDLGAQSVRGSYRKIGIFSPSNKLNNSSNFIRLKQQPSLQSFRDKVILNSQSEIFSASKSRDVSSKLRLKQLQESPCQLDALELDCILTPRGF